MYTTIQQWLCVGSGVAKDANTAPSGGARMFVLMGFSQSSPRTLPLDSSLPYRTVHPFCRGEQAT